MVLHGARAAEAALLDDLEALLAPPGTADLAATLAAPVRVVVPSRALRLHLAARLTAHLGRAVAGVVIQTSHGLALEVIERLGETVPRGRLLFEVLVRRLARQVPALSGPLDPLTDGYRVVGATVRDLLDAGLEPALEEAALEALAGDGARATGEVERARALVRTALFLEHALEVLEIGRSSTLLRRARQLLEEAPEAALPARAVLIHGFADATGLTTDLLEALVRHRGARFYLDRPPDPADPAGETLETAFSERLAERMTSALPAAAVRHGDSAGAAGAQVDVWQAAGPEGEARQVSRRLRHLLDGGARPEGIAVVARNPEPYRLPLRRHLERLGIPFSALGTRGSLEPAGHAAHALLALLRRGEDAATDRWLDTRGPQAPHLVELRVAFRALGAGRLREAAELDVKRFVVKGGKVPLPIRQGLAALEDDGAEGGTVTRATRRYLDGGELRDAVAEAAGLCRRLRQWPDRAAAQTHFEELFALVREDLGWRPEQPRSAAVLERLDEVARQIPAALELSRAEFLLVLDEALADVGWAPLGGAGGGVQVLTVTEARGLTFEHLFVLGLNRDVFPRPVHEDPLLSDALRRRLLGVLPDVPLKRRGFDEERHLFAQLLSASPHVSLSWQSQDEEGQPRSPSPLLERLRWRSGLAETAPAGDVPRPAAEVAIETALHLGRDAVRPLLAQVVEEARSELGRIEVEVGVEVEGQGLAPAPLAAAQLRILDEMDPDRSRPEGRRTRRGLGPYFGFVGRALPGDPRERPLFVTLLENFAACPWQAFLQRLLAVEPTPDPLEALPALDALLVGRLVHGVLEKMVEGRLGKREGRSLSEASEPAAVAWAPPLEIETLLHREAASLLREAGIGLPGLERALRDQARPYLEAARALDFAGGAVPVLGAELEGRIEVRDARNEPRQVFFRADRVDRLPEGLRLTDYKTGKPISLAVKESTRHRHFLQGVASGRTLQAVAYSLVQANQPADGSMGGSMGGSMAEGRYLYLEPDLDEEVRTVLAPDRDEALQGAFAHSVRNLLAGWDAGAFFPRLVEPDDDKEPARCNFCEVAQACLRRDSGARQRLRDHAARLRQPAQSEGGDEGGEPPAEPEPQEAAFLGVWTLPSRESNHGR